MSELTGLETRRRRAFQDLQWSLFGDESELALAWNEMVRAVRARPALFEEMGRDEVFRRLCVRAYNTCTAKSKGDAIRMALGHCEKKWGKVWGDGGPMLSFEEAASELAPGIVEDET